MHFIEEVEVKLNAPGTQSLVDQKTEERSGKQKAANRKLQQEGELQVSTPDVPPWDWRVFVQLIVCGVLFVLILAPTDCKLKYTEVLHGNRPESLLLRSVNSAKRLDLQREDPATSDSSARLQSNGDRREQDADRDEVNRSGESSEDLSVSCFPPVDLFHKYDWAQYQLRHLPERSWVQDHTQTIDGETSARSSVKRSDYNRELSADLYAQYPSSCACQTKYELLDLGYTHFPRYIVNAICQNRSANSRKCWRGSSCKEIPYKVRVLTRRSANESSDQDHHSTLLPEPLREYWRFKTVTIAAACQCSI
ncbi:AGAP000859-PA-like protein [Anopheles sinensis]|uniref:AGAP000859-PA-like protein n=1 Tax=Anopheles sinensis TaxID=74873 RepID=A0A084WFF2_ANOSI|nr:AGAP000859-PA-like protein [Anopheles sinensis]